SYWTGLPVTVSNAAGASGSIFLVSAAGGSPRTLVPEFASARHPIWSPDGRHVLFIGDRGARQRELDWFVVPAEGGDAIKTGALQVLRSAGASAPSDRPIPTAWTKRDDAVLMTTTVDARANVWKLSISPSTGQINGSPKRLTFGTAIERGPTAGANGRVAF